MSKLFEQLKEQRGIGEEFLHPKYEQMMNPFVLPDMVKAVERIKKAIRGKEGILIYGDYDVDGVTASAIMRETLEMAGAEKVEIMLPNRFTDGYGMNKKVIQRAVDTGVKLVVTVDCGSLDKEIIQELSENGIETIVTDHHECIGELPEAVAVINPKRANYEGFKKLSGAGVAFKVAQALVKEGLIKSGREKWLLDLVAIGTICDAMPLIQENRIIGYYGILVLEKTKRPGLRELMRVAGVKKVNSEAVGFQIGPRLNAAGRLKSPELALNLICAKTRAEAAGLAAEIEELNKARRSRQDEAVKEITARGQQSDPVVIEVGKWHEGIIGIVAGKITELYYKPTFIITETEEGVYKGSGRSFGDYHLADVVKECREREILLAGGGHAEAAGVTFEKENLATFREIANDFYRKLKIDPDEQKLLLDPKEDLELEEIGGLTLDFLEEMKQLEPFGEGNREPIFRLRDIEIIEVRKMGSEGKHLRVDVRGKDGKIIKLVAFYAPEEWTRIYPGENRDILISVIENEWNGVRSVEGRVVKIW